MRFLNKKKRTNPKKGPFHHRAPSQIFYRSVRGMVPHKTARGEEALKRLKVFEGTPPPYDKVKRVVVPQALRYLRLAPNRRYANLGRLASEVGWKYSDVISKLEDKRKVRSAAFYQRKKAIRNLKAKAAQKVSEDVQQTLAAYGH